MATLLIGYDTESAAVGEGLARFIGPEVPQYRAALDPDSTRRGVALLERLHGELEAPCTFFVCGRTLLHALDAFEPLAASSLFDIQQHTYSHVVFRDVRYQAEGAETEAVIPETPHVALREELALHLGADPQVSRSRVHRRADAVRLLPRPARPARPARDRPRTPAIASSPRGAATRRTATRRRGCSPSATRRRGSPDLLEIPFQFWLDGVWFDVHGYDQGAAFGRALRGAIDEIAEQDLVFATAFHEWVALEADEEGTGWIRTLIEHARERGVEIRSYADYWAATASQAA